MIRRILLSLLALSLFVSGTAFASEKAAKAPVKPAAKTSVKAAVKNDAEETDTGTFDQGDSEESDSGSEDPVDQEDRQRERQKAVDDVNAFLIESYKIKLDRALADVYQSVRAAAKDDSSVQTSILKRILSEIETKVQALSDRPVGPNRKKILLAVFSYMKADIESKIRSIGGK